MRDEDWRGLERIWRADPGDQDALQRAIAARRRVGVPVPGWMLEKQVLPPRRFEADLPLHVGVQLPDGRPADAGRTPGTVELPAHRAWWVQPETPTDASLARLGAVPALARTISGLSLRPDVTDRGLAELAAFSGLTRLDLSGCTRITTLESVGRMESLEAVDLWSCPRSVANGLAPLAGLPRLTALNLTRCRVTDLAPLRGLTELHALFLSGATKLADAALEPLAGLERLAVLDLGETAIRGEGFAVLAGLPELTLLNLSGCSKLRVEALEQLAPLRNLAALYVVGCGRAATDAAKLMSKVLPRCEVVAGGP